MISLLKEGDVANIKTQEFLLETEEDIKSIPDNVPVGSIALYPTASGLSAKMKFFDGTWKAI